MQTRVAHAAGGAVLAAFVLLLVLLSFVGCGPSLPSSPEALFAEVQELQVQGEYGKIWDLFTDERREAEMKGIDGMRRTLARNPGAQNLVKQYHCTLEEFQRLSYVQIFVREHQGLERVLVNAKIADRQPDPRRPDEVTLTIHVEDGSRLAMRAKQVQGGWRLMGFESMGK
jgi:hypothetical protein